jgi:hypothetical protein
MAAKEIERNIEEVESKAAEIRTAKTDINSALQQQGTIKTKFKVNELENYKLIWNKKNSLSTTFH